LDSIAQTTSGFQYTPEFFTNGNKVFTTPIDGSTVLSDPSDFADSENLFWFADLDFTGNPDRTIKNQFILDYIRTSKRSSYSYAIDTQQLALENKLSLTEEFDFLNSLVTYGGSVRFTRARQLQDFWDEPFSRRDISLPTISGNSEVFAGGLDPEGNIRWNSPFAGFSPAVGGSSVESDLFQYSLFAFSENEWSERWTTYTSLLGAFAHYKVGVPSAAVGGFAAPRDDKGDMWYYSASFSPVYRITDNWNAYVMAQYGTSIEPLQGGPILGENALSTNRLYEIGTKVSLLENRLFASLAGYTWRQSTFNTGAGGDSILQLEGEGVELEVTFLATDRLTLIGSANQQITELKAPLGFRVAPASEEDFALFGGELQTPFSQAQGGFDPALLGPPANNPDLRVGAAPDTQLKLFAVYELENGFGLSGGGIWSDSYWASYDRQVKLPSSLVFDASIFYRQPNYEIRLYVENLTSEDYFFGADPTFAAAGIITKAPERTFKISYAYNF
jgi:iron complex outermembrane recepter protein